MKFFTAGLFIFLSGILHASEIPQTDSMNTAISKLIRGRDELRSVRLLDSVANILRNSDPPHAMYYSERAVSIARHLDDSKILANALITLARIHRQLSDMDGAIKISNEALDNFRKRNDTSGYVSCYTDIGNVHYLTGNQDKALTAYYESLRLSEAIRDSSSIARSLNNIGNIYYAQKNYNKTIEYYEKALKINEALGDKRTSVLIVDNIAIAYQLRKEYEKALSYHFNALKMIQELGDKQAESEILVEIGSCYEETKDYKRAIEYFQKAEEAARSINNQYVTLTAMLDIGLAYKDMEEYSKAIKVLDKCAELTKRLNMKAILQEAYGALYQVYDKQNDKSKALEYFKLFADTKDSVMNEESLGHINELESRYKTSEKEKEIEILEKNRQLQEAELKQKSILNYSLFAGIALVAVLLLVIFNRYREKQKANVELEEKNAAINRQKDETNQQKELVEEKNREITDSINYAKLIQDAVLPSENIRKEFLPDSFVFYSPRDIISGDFYWLTRRNEYIYVAVADCTGHGVPGALMSMLGISLLRQVINETPLTDPAAILNALHKLVLQALNEDVNMRNSKDGMDIGLLRIHLPKKEAAFAGAVRPLYYACNGRLDRIKGERYSIGGVKKIDGESYTTHTFTFESPACFYLFTDGYTDQFGGPSRKKFMAARLQQLLGQVIHLPAAEQERAVSGAFMEWKESYPQTDDVLFMGIKI